MDFSIGKGKIGHGNPPYIDGVDNEPVYLEIASVYLKDESLTNSSRSR